MDYRQLFSDPALKEEFLDRFDEIRSSPELAAGRPGGFESMGGLEGGLRVPSTDDAATAAERMAEGTWSPDDSGLEAIIKRFTRPVHLVQQSTFAPPPDDFPDSGQISQRLETAREALERVIPSAGRIDVTNHRLDWVGTGWVVAPGVVITNRHVAEEFARRDDGGFAFRQNFGGRITRASVDWRREHMQPDESVFRVEEILWIEPDASVDVALLRVTESGRDGEPAPAVIDLVREGDLSGGTVGRWIGVIGYPAQDSRNDAADQQRIFDGIYNVKRLAPGQVTAVVGEDLLHHDATTLGGNSGSVVVDLETGRALGLHFGGIEGEQNSAVQVGRVAQIVQDHVTQVAAG